MLCSQSIKLLLMLIVKQSKMAMNMQADNYLIERIEWFNVGVLRVATPAHRAVWLFRVMN
jgi:hypothetical protein